MGINNLVTGPNMKSFLVTSVVTVKFFQPSIVPIKNQNKIDNDVVGKMGKKLIESTILVQNEVYNHQFRKEKKC